MTYITTDGATEIRLLLLLFLLLLLLNSHVHFFTSRRRIVVISGYATIHKGEVCYTATGV